MSVTRREALSGAALGLLFAAVPGAACSQTRTRHNPIYGCTLPHSEASAFLRGARDSALALTGQETIIKHSEDRDFDRALATTLAQISDTFSVAPSFAYYDDEKPNAYATSDVRSYGQDGTVLFGLNLRRQLMAANEAPEVAVACVCAHEFGHILQYKLKLDEKLKQGQPTVKRVELQADFFAGYYAGLRRRARPSFPAAVFAMTQYNMGDAWVDQPEHHGTKQERGDAIQRGYDAAYRENKNLSEAIESSMAYFSTL
jgi:hypothetical protein